MHLIYSILTLIVCYPHALFSYTVQCFGFRCVEKDYCIKQTVWIAGLGLQKTVIGFEHYTNYKILNTKV